MTEYIKKPVLFIGIICMVFTLTAFTMGQENNPGTGVENEKKDVHLMDKIVVTAKRYESKAFNTSLAITIIDRETIDKIQPVTTADIFKNQPGIDVFRQAWEPSVP